MNIGELRDLPRPPFQQDAVQGHFEQSLLCLNSVFLLLNRLPS